MDFHKGTYVWPEEFTIMAHQVLAADMLGDNLFVKFVCSKLKLPAGRISRTQDVRMAIRDMYKLTQIVTLTHSKQLQCLVCKDDFKRGLETTTNVVPRCHISYLSAKRLESSTYSYVGRYGCWGKKPRSVTEGADQS